MPGIAEYFKVRQQRVMAILALRQVEAQMQEQGVPMHTHYEQLMEVNTSPPPPRPPFPVCHPPTSGWGRILSL